jgi:hypothetical protein
LLSSADMSTKIYIWIQSKLKEIKELVKVNFIYLSNTIA